MGSVESNRLTVGQVVRRERTRRGWSVESAIAACGLGHMTWRRIERGERVQKRSYSGVDHAFGWPAGRTLAAIDADNESDDVTRLLDDPTAAAATASSEVSYDQLERDMEQLSLSSLRTLTATMQRRLAEIDRLLSMIADDVTYSHHPDVRQALGDYNSRLILRISDATGERYEATFHDVWHAWSELAALHEDYNAAVHGQSVRIRDLEALAERAREVNATLTRMIEEFRAIEQIALAEDQSTSTSA